MSRFDGLIGIYIPHLRRHARALTGEVAQILGIPVGTVTSRLARARVRLRVLLDDGSEQPALKVIK